VPKKSTAQLDREIEEALAAKRRFVVGAKYSLDEIRAAMNVALGRFPSLLKASEWDFGSQLLEATASVLRSEPLGATYDPDTLELWAFPGAVIDLPQTRRGRRVVMR
jgi:hypothetical protein